MMEQDDQDRDKSQNVEAFVPHCKKV